MAGLWIFLAGTKLGGLALWIVWCRHEVHRPNHTMKHRDRATASEVTPAPVPAWQYTPVSPYMAGSRGKPSPPAEQHQHRHQNFTFLNFHFQFSKARTCMHMHSIREKAGSATGRPLFIHVRHDGNCECLNSRD
jgi:hypothetical protein